MSAVPGSRPVVLKHSQNFKKNPKKAIAEQSKRSIIWLQPLPRWCHCFSTLHFMWQCAEGTTEHLCFAATYHNNNSLPLQTRHVEHRGRSQPCSILSLNCLSNQKPGKHKRSTGTMMLKLLIPQPPRFLQLQLSGNNSGTQYKHPLENESSISLHLRTCPVQICPTTSKILSYGLVGRKDATYLSTITSVEKGVLINTPSSPEIFGKMFCLGYQRRLS